MTYSKNSTNASLFSNLSASSGALGVPILNPSTISDFSSMFYEVIYDGSIYAAKEMLKKSLVTLMPLLLLSLMLLLAYLEIQTKFSATALRILLNNDKNNQRKVLVINLAQCTLLLALLYLGHVSPELQALAAYILAAKIIQTSRERIKFDLVGILITAAFVLVRPQAETAVLEPASGAITDLTVSVLPVLFVCLLLVLAPVIVLLATLALTTTLVWWGLRAIVILRRKFPEDFDFFVTLAISVLVWKILRRELIQQMHGGRRTALSSPGVLDSFLGSIVQVGHTPGYFGRLENLTKPDSMSFLEFFQDLSLHYRTLDILSSAYTEGGCRLTVSQPPSCEGVTGYLQSALYRLYVLASWVLPEAYQSHLSRFGFNATTLVISCDCDCHQLNRQKLLEKYN